VASEVDICNLALAHIGDGANVRSITPPDETVQAEKCAIFYPIARDIALESHGWSFAVQRAELNQLVTNPVDSWSPCD
jgi:hypothetical protein